MDLENFCELQNELLQLEREAEIATGAETAQLSNPRSLADSGIGLFKLKIHESKSGFFGRRVLTFKRRNLQDFPANRITTGQFKQA